MLPAPHVWQADGDELPKNGLKVPASHDLHAFVEELDHLPALQGTHDEAPDKVNVLVTLPGLHTRHEDEPGEE